MSFHDMMVFTGNANARLAHSVVEHLGMRLGKAQVGASRMAKSTSKSSKTSAVATSSCCNRPARQPTTT